MSKAYRITDWKKRYEVTKKGRAFDEKKPDEELRLNPLEYYRSKIYGHSLSSAYRELTRVAWRPGEINELAVFGLFHKLMELAADQQREYRGWILDKDQKPIGAPQIARLLDVQEVSLVQKGIDILCRDDIGWVELAEFPGESGTSRTIPERPGLFRSVPERFINETESKINLNETKGIPERPKSGPASVSDFQSDISVSEFPTAEKVEAVRSDTARFLCEILQPSPNNPSDITTFRDILDQLTGRVNEGLCTIEIFDAVVEVARVCQRDGINKIAMFVKAMKEKRFGYVPERRPRVISKNY